MTRSNSVLSSFEDGILTLTLNRPDKLNAFNGEMHMAFRKGLERATEDDAVRVVLLTGAGRGFCAGADLSDRDSGAARDLGQLLDTTYNPNIRLIRALEKPVVCAVNGVAAGAGANIALACDIVIAARSARFIQAFAKIGLVPDAGGSWILPRIIGEPRAKALAMTAEPLGAETAAEWGLIWKAVEDTALMDEARTLAQSLATGPTLGLGMTKRLIHAAGTNSLEQQLEMEIACQRIAGFSADYAEGVSAFLEKRKATFRGQ